MQLPVKGVFEMAKKNAKFSDNSDSSLLFDGRTGAVMAATSQEDLKQKVQAVREVVPSRSNNDILLVLQYYDSDVDRATQAFLEDGAKEALDNWHFSGNKPTKSKKKKNKNKSKDIPLSSDQPSPQIPSDALSVTKATVSLTTGEPKQGQDSSQLRNGLPHTSTSAEPQNNLNGDSLTTKDGASFTDVSTTAGLPYTNGLPASRNASSSLDNKAYSSQVPYTDSQFLPVASTEKIPVPNSLNCDIEHSLDNGLSISSTASTLSSLESSPINNHTPNLGISSATASYNHTSDSGNLPSVNNHVTIESLQNNNRKEPGKEQRKAKDRSKSREKSSEKEKNSKKGQPGVNSPALQRKKDPASPVKKTEAVNSPGLVRKNAGQSTKKSEGNKATSSASVALDFGTKGHLHPRQLEVKPRERNISEASVSSTGTNSTVTGDLGRGHKDHRGLEKSMKDLQRQVISLHRHRNILSEECEKAQKSITKVFSELKESLIDREASLSFQMDQLKTQATDVLVSRQHQATELKKRTDRAEKMTDQELQELRGDIKHFVSDRKVDEDIASQNKFHHDFEQVRKLIQNFGEIQMLKYNYSPRRPSVSSVSSSMTDPLSPLTPVTPVTPATTPSATTTTSSASSSHPPLPRQPASSSQQKKPTFPNSAKHGSSSIGGGPMATFHQVTTGAKVVSQSDSVTQFETSGDLDALLEKKKDHFNKSNNRRSQTPAGRGRSAGRGQGRNQAGPGQRGQKNLNRGEDREESPAVSVVTREDDDLGDTDTSSTSTSEKRKSRNIRRRQKQRERQKERKHLSRSTSESSLVSGTTEERGDGDGPHKVVSVNHQSDASKQLEGQSGTSTQQASKDPAASRGKNQYNINNRSQSPTKSRNIHNNPEGTRPQSSSKGRYQSGNRSGNRSQSPTKRTNYNPNNTQRSQSPTKGNATQGNHDLGRSQSPRKAGSQSAGHDGKIKIDNKVENKEGSASSNKDSVKFSEDTKKMDATNGNKSMDNSGSGSQYRRGYSSPSGRGSNRGRGRGGLFRSRSKSEEQKRRSQGQGDGKGHVQGQQGERSEKHEVKTEKVKDSTQEKTGVQNGLKSDKEEGHRSKEVMANGSVDHKQVEKTEGNQVLSNNNNNNKGVETGEECNNSFLRDEHTYEENGNDHEMKSTSLHIQEHIYEEALPQRKPRGRQSRKTEVTTVTADNTTTSTKIITMETVTTETTKEVKLNGEVNGVSLEHRWSNEELDQIS